jgi:hypothetical protein
VFFERLDALWTRSGDAMTARPAVQVRLEERVGERPLVTLRLPGGERVARLRAAEARDLAVRLLEVAHVARVGRPRRATR